MDGLKSLNFIDKVANGAKESETRDQVSIASEVDRIYCNVPDSLQVNFGKDYSIAIEKTGLKDTGSYQLICLFSLLK